jgi:CSLREA domain-containing protein
VSVGIGGGRRQAGRGFVTALVALSCVLAAPAVAGAETFTVNSTGDGVDVALGDENCLTVGGECTLRAAIEEGDSLGEFTTIRFEEGVFAGQPAATISLGDSLPTVTVGVSIEGTCETGAGVSGPCVGIDGPSGKPALVVSGAEEGEISGLAMTGAQTAIVLQGAPRTKIRGNWLGVALDGTSPGNGTGVLVGPGSNRSFVGGEGTQHRNVFAGNAADGLDVHGAANVKVFGNYFGVEPDGVTPRANGGDDIEVTSVSGGLEAIGTEIGTRVNSTGVASPLCDWGCNVISGATSNGIDLAGDGGSEAPASSTSVAGNYIGLDADGTAAAPNTGAGVRVGEAPHTIVGGPAAGEANRINGGSVGVLAGPAAGDLSVRGNLIGIDPTGTKALAPPDEGIVVDSAELASPTLEAEIVNNEIWMEGGIAISQQGQGAWILGNEIFGSQIGVKTFGPTAYGNVVEGNLVEGPAANGILVENDLNEIAGNEILGAGAAGIWVKAPPVGTTGNTVGGDAATEENLIDGSGGAAIEILNKKETNNEVARNRGAGNAGLFIDLVAASPATEVGPNRGIKPPTFSTTTQTAVGGGAEKGATVRVFRKQLAAAGELESFLGEAVANDSGGWKVTYDVAIPAGTIIAATQTMDGATSELAIGATPGSEDTPPEDGEDGGGEAILGGGTLLGGGTSGSPAIEPARIRPETKILRGRLRSRTVRFVFESDQADSAFLCKLDGKPFDLCSSPRRFRGLEPGKHTFWVRAIDPFGHVDLSPAKKKFVVPG